MEPLTWIMLALMAAGTAASAQGQKKTGQARAGVMQEERERRSKQQKEGEASAMNTAEAFARTKAKEEERAAELAASSAKIAPPTETAGGTKFLGIEAPVSSTQMVEGYKGAQARAQARADQHHAAMGKLSAFGDVMLDNSILAGKNAQDIGQGAGFTQGWQQNVLPALMERANGAGRDWATAGDVMKLAATIMAPFALGQSAAASAAKAAGEAAKQGVLSTPTNMFNAYQLPGLQPGALSHLSPMLKAAPWRGVPFPL